MKMGRSTTCLGWTVTPLEYRDAIKRLGMSLETAAKLQGIPEETSRKRARGDIKVPPEADVLLRLMLAMRLSPQQVMEHIANSN
jgi:hypothetical protein